MTTILITGSNGYVGNFLAEHLSSAGFQVIGVDLTTSSRQLAYQNFIFEPCDVRDRNRLCSIFRRYNPSHVIHLAYLMNSQHDRNFEDDVDVNGSINVFLAANETQSVKQFIHFSSASVYGGWPDNPMFMTEEHPAYPRDWVYAQNKKKVENFYFGMQKRDGLKLVNLRMCTAVGPSYFKKGGVVAALAKSPVGVLLDGKDIYVQFIHEDDVKKLARMIINDEKIEGTYNLSSETAESTRNLNSDRFLISFPRVFFRSLVWFLWKLRISPLSPTAVNLMSYSVVVSSQKIKDRYGYEFLYSTKSAYEHAVSERKKKGLL